MDFRRGALAAIAAFVVISAASAASTTVVISEFRTRGPLGGNDEFVEIYNLSSTAVNIGGWKLKASNSSGTVGVRATVPANIVLSPGCHYLFTNTGTGGYSGSVPGNTTYSTGITDDGGVAITTAADVIVDQAGMSAGSAFKEGTILAQTTTNLNQSYERKPGGSSGSGTDTDNNASDFVYHASSSDPQNLSSGCISVGPSVPAAPTGLSATAGNAHVALSWNAISGVTSYNVKRSSVSGGPYTTISSPATNSYDDTTAANGTTYFYVVSAVNSVGEGANSSEVSATPTAPPAAPTGLTPTAGDAHVALAWSALSGATSYKVKRSTVSGGPYGTIATPTTNSYDDTSVVNGTTYFYVVSAVNAGGEGPNSSEVSATPQTATSTPPTGAATANPPSVLPGATTTIKVTVTPGANPASSGITVTGDLSAIGGALNQSFTDNHDGTFSFSAVAAFTATVGPKTLTITVKDAEGRSSTTTAALTILPTTTVKISQVYGGGGNSGSTYTNDFIELFNSGSTAVSLDGWSVQETSAAASATSWSANGAPTALSGVILPGHYYLVKEAAGNAGTTPLPAPDATGVITIGGTSGKLALVAGTTPLNGACPTDSVIVDMVGYGAASCFKGAPTGSLSATTAAIRKNNGCVDTANNLNDFLIDGPIPRNSASPVNSCGGDPTQPSGIGLATAGSLEATGSTLLTVKVTPATTPPSTGIAVSGDLTSIGGSASQQFFDDGTHGDATAGDNVFSFYANVPGGTSFGLKSILTTLTDAQNRMATAPIALTVQSPTCGVERWAVKTGQDTLASQVNVSSPVRSTIPDLSAIPAPALNQQPPYDPRFSPTETTAFVVNGTLTVYKKEDDVDYHIVLQDAASGKTLIAEIPSPACVGTSPFLSGVTSARANFDSHLTASGLFQTANVPVQVKGVGFFDFIHGQTGVALNGIELHPVVEINFTRNTTTSLSSSANPSQYAQSITITATVGNGGPPAPTGNVTFFDGGNMLATRALDNSGHATYITNGFAIGTHSITASYEGDSTSASSASAALSQSVIKADQTITFAALPDKNYGDAPFTVSAIGGGSSNAVTFTATGNCTSGGLNGSTITITAAGSCTVSASQLGDNNYNAAAGVSRSFGINPAAASIHVNGYSGVYDGHAHGATGSATGVNGENLNALLSLGPTFTDVPGGSAHWTFAGNANYAATAGDVSITITQANAALNVNGYSGVYDGHAHGATGTATGVNGENLNALLSLGPTFTDAPGGSAHWTFAGNTDYAPSAGDATITITQAAATIHVNGYSGVYDGHAHGATGTASGVLGENLTNLLNLGATFTNVPGGSAHWTFAGNTNYAATAGDVNITITQASASFNVNGYNGVYDGHAHGATGSATGVNGENLNALLSLGPTFTDVPGGTAHWTFAGNTNYAATAGDVSITITQANATLNVNGYSGVYDGHAHGATGSATGVLGENLAGLLNLGPSFTDVPGGTAHWTFAGNANYASTAGDVNIQITQASAAISVSGYSGTYDGHAHGATGSATGVLGENLAGLLNLGPSFTDVPGGSAHWTFAGNTDYAPSAGDATITITQAAATIHVNGYSGVYDGHAHGATGSATGVLGENLAGLLNLGPSFTNVPGGSAHWTFAGNTDYAPSAGDATITITQAAATIHVNGYSGVYDGHAHGATGTASGVNGENLNALLSLGATFTNVPGGTAHWTFAGNTNYAPAAGDVSITISQAKANISVNGYSGVYDGAPHGATGSAIGVNGENLTPLLNLGPTFTNVPGGTANWTFAGDVNYSPASASAAIIINPAIPVVTVSGLTPSGDVPIYDGTPKVATAAATGIGGIAVQGSFTFTYNGSLTPPINPGTYAVLANFSSANANYAGTTGTGTLTIRGLRDDLQNQVNAIAALRNGTTNTQDINRLNDSITHLGEALEPDHWLDSIHGTTADGDGIFTESKNGLIPLLLILRDARSTITAAQLQPIINRIVTDARQLALTAINDAAGHGKNVDKARSELSKGDADINAGQYESGMEHYRSAWSFAVK